MEDEPKHSCEYCGQPIGPLDPGIKLNPPMHQYCMDDVMRSQDNGYRDIDDFDSLDGY